MSVDALIILIGGIATLAVFSFLIKENAFYRLFEHLFIGVAAGSSIIIGFKNFLWPTILKPMLGMDRIHYPDGTWSAPYNYLLLLYLIPLLFGTLYYFIYSKQHAWLAKLVIGFSLGCAGTLAFKGEFNRMLPQITGSFKPLIVKSGESINWLQSFNNTFFVLTLLLVMYYFFFTFKFKASQGKSSYLGRMLLMVCFGAFFGSTVMARLTLLVERIQFLWIDWLGLFL